MLSASLFMLMIVLLFGSVTVVCMCYGVDVAGCGCAYAIIVLAVDCFYGVVVVIVCVLRYVVAVVGLLGLLSPSPLVRPLLLSPSVIRLLVLLVYVAFVAVDVVGGIVGIRVWVFVLVLVLLVLLLL